MSPAPSVHTETVDFVMLYIVGISVILLLGITITMIYFVFKYNRKKGRKPVDIHGNIWLEIVWITIPTLIVLSMFYYGYTGFSEIRKIPENAFEVDVTARMWSWEFNYKNGLRTDTLYVPVNEPVVLKLKSMDVNHSFYIPAFRIKEDAIPNKINFLSFTAVKPGDYDVACAEYCGLNHSMMYTKVVAMEKSDFEKWYNQNKTVEESE
ncbi:cytochrome c oxidase subunit II [Melioribacter sp. Ez-97]|uniref:cytochrome c oxidase subunit II n=1 Tax=Melioribacter sp. Ez-97 TaxID=3423434 RepID=UPI003EDB0F92